MPPKGEGLLIFKREVEPKGPLAVFGYDYFAERAKAEGIETPKLLSYEGLWGAGEEYAYEALNFFGWEEKCARDSRCMCRRSMAGAVGDGGGIFEGAEEDWCGGGGEMNDLAEWRDLRQVQLAA